MIWNHKNRQLKIPRFGENGTCLASFRLYTAAIKPISFRDANFSMSDPPEAGSASLQQRRRHSSHPRGPAPSALLLGNLAHSSDSRKLSCQRRLHMSFTNRWLRHSTKEVRQLLAASRRPFGSPPPQGPSRQLAPAYHAVRAYHTGPRKSLLLKARNMIFF